MFLPLLVIHQKQAPENFLQYSFESHFQLRHMATEKGLAQQLSMWKLPISTLDFAPK